jgi:alkaline phosphatase D
LPLRAALLPVLLLLAACDSREPRKPAAAAWIWIGAVTDSTAEIRAKITRPLVRARVEASHRGDFDSLVVSRAVRTLPFRKDEVYLFRLGGLRPDTPYRFRLIVDDSADTASAGTFRTFPSGPASFRFALGSCARTGSTHPVFDRILDQDPLFFLHTGDLHYENVASTDPDEYRRAYDEALASPVQRRFFRSLPVPYMWDDHDFGGDNSDSTSHGREAARKIYREYVPHYPLARGGTLQQAFTVGRIRFLVTDCRSGRSPWKAPDGPKKTMLGPEQKDWLKAELLAARDAYPLIVWVSSLPWIGTGGKDGWSMYAHERRELASFIAGNGIGNLCMLSGDAHMLAIDDGTHSGYAEGGGGAFPVFHAAPLDRPGSVKGGPYSHGTLSHRGQFGLMSVRDRGGEVEVTWEGMDHSGAVVMRHSFKAGNPR